MKKVIECVPNFSEGRDLAVIKQITDGIENVQGIRMLDVDPGASTNRTVVTFVGEPEPVKEAAFRAVQKAAELIDMSKHKGEHARFGATDVCRENISTQLSGEMPICPMRNFRAVIFLPAGF